MKTIESNGLKAQIKQIKRDGSLFLFEVFAYDMEHGDASVVASGKIVCNGACDVQVAHGSISPEMESAMVEALCEV